MASWEIPEPTEHFNRKIIELNPGVLIARFDCQRIHSMVQNTSPKGDHQTPTHEIATKNGVKPCLNLEIS